MFCIFSFLHITALEDEQVELAKKSPALARLSKSQVLNKSIDDTIRRFHYHYSSRIFIVLKNFEKENRFDLFILFSMQHYHVNLLM